MSLRNLRHYFYLLLMLIAFSALLLWPISRVLQVAFFGTGTSDKNPSQFTWAYVAAVFQDASFRNGLMNSAIIAVSVTFLCLLISMPLALLSTRYNFFGKGLASALILVPMILPPFVGAIGMRQMLGRFGVLTSIAQHFHWLAPNTPYDWMGKARFLGIIIVEALSLYPIMYLNLSAVLANLDPAMEQAAANLGASRWRIFRKITFPLMRPGLFAGGTIVLIWSFTELGTPLMFDYDRVTPVQIFNRITQVNDNPMPYALTFVMLASSIVLYIFGKFVLGRQQPTGTTKASTQSVSQKLGFFKSMPVLFMFLLVSGFALLPHVGVILFSVSGLGGWYQSAVPKVFTSEHYMHGLSHELALPSVLNSCKYASISTLVDIILGIMIGWMLVRSKIKGRILLDSLTMLPIAVPGLVLAFGYLGASVQLQKWLSVDNLTAWATKIHVQQYFSTKSFQFIRDLFNVNENPTLLLVIAYSMRRLPYVVRSVVAGLEQTPEDLELAAQNLGASRGKTLRKITIPLISANIIAGGLLAFAFAMLEVSDSLLLAQPTKYWPITKAIWELYSRLRDGPYIASALGVWAMVLLTLTILSANSLLGKKMGAIFRV